MEKMYKSLLLVLLISCSTCHFDYSDGSIDLDRGYKYTSTPTVIDNNEYVNVLRNGRVNLLSDNGKYLARCQDCGAACESNSAGVHITDPSLPWAIWNIQTVGNKVAFKADSGKYLARCVKCWNNAAYKDAAFVHVSDSSKPQALWTPIYIGEKKWAFKSDSGYFLSRCQNCVTGGKYSNFAFTSSLDSNAACSRWQISYLDAIISNSAIPISSDIEVNILEFGRVNLLSDNGKYLARCQDCGNGIFSDSAGVHITDPSLPQAIWTLEIVGNQVAFKADSGKYLAHCDTCWKGANYKDAVFVHLSSLSKACALWTPVYLGGRKWAFQSDVGYYLARCQNCVTGGSYPNFAFAYPSDYNDAISQWQVSYVFPAGPISLQMSTGKYLTRCNNCGPSVYPDSASIYEIDPTNPSVFWNVEKFGNQIAFVADSGKYLARCSKCWKLSTYPDAAFLHVTSAKNNQLALWTPIYIGYGKWIFRGSNGKYLSRCQSCVDGGAYTQFAFVHGTDYTNPNTQWWISTTCA